MHAIKLNVQDNVFDKVIYFLQNLPKKEEYDSLQEDMEEYRILYGDIA